MSHPYFSLLHFLLYTGVCSSTFISRFLFVCNILPNIINLFVLDFSYNARKRFFVLLFFSYALSFYYTFLRRQFIFSLYTIIFIKLDSFGIKHSMASHHQTILSTDPGACLVGYGKGEVVVSSTNVQFLLLRKRKKTYAGGGNFKQEDTLHTARQPAALKPHYCSTKPDWFGL